MNSESRSIGLRQRADSDVAPLDHERLAGADPGAGVGVDLALAQAVDLQADEPSRVRLVDRFIDNVLDRLTVHPGLDPRSAGDDAYLVPAVIDEVGMPLLDLL